MQQPLQSGTLGDALSFNKQCRGAQADSEGCLGLPSNCFPEGALNPVPRNTHSFGGFPSLSDKGSSGLMGLNALRNPSGAPCSCLPQPGFVFGPGPHVVPGADLLT